MLKELFHKNSIELFNLLEKIGLAKIARFFLAKKLNNNLKISLPIFMLATPELHKSNDWYGHATSFKRYVGSKIDYSIKAAIEHGPFFGDFIWPQDLNNSLPTMITFSKNRAEFLKKKTDKKIFAIGPYIYYALHYLSKKQLQREKKRLGKNLLVFPVHSTSISPFEYDIENFCREIKRIAKRFNTVRICLYWKDMIRGQDKYYRKYNFECVTAGHIFDPSFLSRLKTIIFLADTTMSNSVGTHLGYSVFMKKPHYVYRQRLKFPTNDVDAKRGKQAMVTDDYKKMEVAFSKRYDHVTTQQYDLARNFFGFGQVKSPASLKKVLKTCEYLWRKRGN